MTSVDFRDENQILLTEVDISAHAHSLASLGFADPDVDRCAGGVFASLENNAQFLQASQRPSGAAGPGEAPLGRGGSKPARGSYKCSRCGVPKKGHVCPIKEERAKVLDAVALKLLEQHSALAGKGSDTLGEAFRNDPKGLTDSLSCLLKATPHALSSLHTPAASHSNAENVPPPPPNRSQYPGAQQAPLHAQGKATSSNNSGAAPMSSGEGTSSTFTASGSGGSDGMAVTDELNTAAGAESAGDHRPAGPYSAHNACLLRVLSLLPPDSLVAAGAVCRRWAGLASTVLRSTLAATLVAEPARPAEHYIPAFLARCPNLRHLTLKAYCSVDDEALNALGRASPALESLTLEAHDDGVVAVEGSGLQALVDGCHSLQMLRIHGCAQLGALSLTSTSLRAVELLGATGLQTVTIDCPRLLEFSLDMLPGPATVPHHPAAAWAAAAEEEDWMALALGAVARGCPKLQRVHVASSALSDKAVAAFLRCVLSFETGFTGLSNAGGAARELASPHRLCAASWTHAQKLTDTTVERIAKRCSQLTFLDLSGCCGLTDIAVQFLVSTSADSLSHLLLAGCPQLSAGAFQSALSELPRLELLDLGYSLTAPSEQAPKAVFKGSSASLKQLSLWGCSALEGVELDCPKLVELNVNGCKHLQMACVHLACPRLCLVHAKHVPEEVARALTPESPQE